MAQECYVEQMDAFSKLFQDEQFYQRVMGEMAKAMYLNLRNQPKPTMYPDSEVTGMAAEDDKS